MPPLDLRALGLALPKKTSACVSLLLSVACMKADDERGFCKNCDAAVETFGDASIVSAKFQTLSGRSLTLISEAVGARKARFVRMLLTRYAADATRADAASGMRCALEIALSSDEGYGTLLEGGFLEHIAPEGMEAYVGRVRPDLMDALAARRRTAERPRGRKLQEVPSDSSTSVSRSLAPSDSDRTIPNDSLEVAHGDSRSAKSDATTDATTASSDEVSSGPSVGLRFEQIALDRIRGIMQELPDFQLRIDRLEEDAAGEDVRELMQIEQQLVHAVDALDELYAEEPTGEEPTTLVRRYRRRAIVAIQQLQQQVDDLLRRVDPELDELANSSS